jgi:hypothetical protein
MSKRPLLSLAAALLLTGGLSTAAFAQAATVVPGHPRVNEVDQRLTNQQNRINAGVADGQVSEKQAAHDATRDAKIATQASKDEAANGGHLTKGEQHRLNRRLNHNSGKIYKQRHDGKPAQQ